MMGISFAERFEKRYIIFEELLLMVEGITNGICYLALPIDEILTGLVIDGTCRSLSFLYLFRQYREAGYDFPDAWKKSVFGCGSYLYNTEREKIANFVLSLGRSDSENQKRILKIYTAQFEIYAEEAYKMKKKYSFTSVITGVLFGGAVFILLI